MHATTISKKSHEFAGVYGIFLEEGKGREKACNKIIILKIKLKQSYDILTVLKFQSILKMFC